MIQNSTMFHDIINNQAYAAWVYDFLTLILVIIAYRQLNKVNNQIEAFRFQEAVKMHITDLKELFHGWKSNLPSVPSAEELPSDKNLPTFERLLKDIAINKMEQNPLFKDVKKDHLPKGYETLPDDWEKYKKLLKEYFNEYDNIVARIKTEVQEKGFFPEPIYTRAVNLIKKERGGKDRWDYYQSQLSQNEYELNYGISYGSSIIEQGFKLIEKGTDEEVKKREELHKTISDKIKSEYEVEFNKLIEKEKELKEQRKGLFDNLKNLLIYPDFPKTGSCDIIMQSFKKQLLLIKKLYKTL